MRIGRGTTNAIALAALLLVTTAAPAQTARGTGGANGQLLQQLQQLASERTSLQAEAARARRELEEVRRERDELKKAQQSAEQRSRASAAALSQSNSERATTEQELQQTRAKMEELIAKFRETVQTLRQTEAENSIVKQGLAAREQQYRSCVERNAALYKINDETLARLEKDSLWSRLARAEPFTRIKRVELENLADDYHGRAEDQRVRATPAAPQAEAEPRR